MLAARILGWSGYGLATLLKEHFGVKLDKRFQRYNWGQRPLSKKALNYARLDTHYLIPLRKIQLGELKKQNRLREATEAFERATDVHPTPKQFDPDDFWRIKGSKELMPQEQAILRELFILRDKIARKRDLPLFKVINDAALVEVARSQPNSHKSLQQIKGVGEKLAWRNGTAIIEAIERGRMAPPPEYPSNNYRPDDFAITRYEVLRQWRNDLAAKRGVEPDVIISNHTLMDIARHNPKTLESLENMDILGEWQCETYGQSVMEILKTL